ncbi:MAG: hypothetical protein IJV27_07380 [Prevotella sp.]|nr:hypothetical protein [Prevotella sp.]
MNEQVDLAGGVWKTVDHTFYWPKTGSVSFISYSPFDGTSNTAGTTPVITKNKITYTGVTADATDLMYADKAACSNNVNEVEDGTNSYTGVPTVFRHALAKLSFKVQANFIEWDDPLSGEKTKWEITLNSFKIGGFKTTGDLELNLNSDKKSWDKPVTTVGTENYNVWTNLSGATADQELVAAPFKLTTTPVDLAAATGFVIPQVLDAGVQTVDIDAHIKTTLANGKTIEEDFIKTVDISEISTLKAWQMNENIVYTIKFKPTASAGPDSGDTPHDNDPEDVIIKFDPATADWTPVDAAATIQL